MTPKLLTAERFIDMRSEISYRYVLSDTEYFRPHYHDYFELFLMLDGSAVHFVNGDEIKLSKGTAVFVRPNDTHDFVCKNGKTFSMLNITFTQATADELFSYLGDGFPSAELISTQIPPSVILSEKDFKAFSSQMESVSAISAEDFGSLKTSLRVVLMRFMVKHFSDFNHESSDIPQWLEDLCEQMKKNGNFTLGTEKMYSLTDKSREHISRSMKKYTGMTVTEYINSLRLNFIANMLQNSNHSVSDIIFESGFNNISWASEQFKEKFGTTMSEYRKKPNSSSSETS